MGDKRMFHFFYWTFISFRVSMINCIYPDDHVLSVYNTTSCPKNSSEWYERSVFINCTNKGGYMCAPDETLMKLYEFCYKFANTGMIEGHCIILNNKTFIDTYDCRGFTSGCPEKSYFTNEMFTYPNCAVIRNGCFQAEQSCWRKENASTQQATVTRQTLTYVLSQESEVLTLRITVISMAVLLLFCIIGMTSGIWILYKMSVQNKKEIKEKEELLNEAKIIRDEHGPPPNPQEYLEDYRQISGCYKT
ncbi:uncharacterized protein LOC144621769 [Crassostrea virginica]